MQNDPLLQPFQLKHLTLRNRIMTSSHEPAYPEEGMPKDRYRAYHVERAKGGIALTMTAGSAVVSPDSTPTFNQVVMYKDEVVPWLRTLADECHDHGAAVMIQLTHMGRRTVWNEGDWLPVVAPTTRREPAHRASVKLIEDWDIERIVRDYADAAERVQAAGLDGFEIECYGHLADAFWTPLLNELTGDYNGGFENRMRFTTEVLQAIRKRVGPDLLVGLRMVADEQEEGGIDAAEGKRIAAHFRDSGLIDFLNIIRGQVNSDAKLTRVIPLTGMASAPHLDFAGEIRQAVDFPVFHAARIPDVATARHAVAEGKLDMVGMTRAHLADPHIVRKIAEGREADIRPCVGATYCLDRIYEGGEALCFHNAATGRERTMPQEIAPAATKRKIVIVGAGPAGLEAARVCGARGHDVTVFEAADQPGGQLRLAVRSPKRRELAGAIDWRMAQCEAHGVAFRFNALAEADDVLTLSPEIVIVATGGIPADPRIPGAELAVSAWDILTGDAKPGSNVLIWDEAGDYTALQAAEVIAETGASVEILNRERSISASVMGMNLTPFLGTLQPLGVTFTPAQFLAGIAQDGNQLRCTVTSDYARTLPDRQVDQVVINHGTQPLDDLYWVLKPLSVNKGRADYDALLAGQPQPWDIQPGGFAMIRIGDAISSRNHHAAIYDALRFCKDM
ncbi:MAG: FAD-dependent oxidoreductase [Rhodospirillaceae bacterium]|nr:FAD-dependent oxidoreductase [Rhodospirillaceae bacterium]MDD9927086.1 FAD-dependent oxidoreductase [Rhodospirillaceae bacterium]